MEHKLPRVVEILPWNKWSAAPIDRVVLDYEDRFRRRIVLKGLRGTRFLLELPEPRLLMDGSVLKLDTGEAIIVEAAAENLAEITCEKEEDLVRVAWHFGNRHLPTQLLRGRLRIREDHVIIDMVIKLGATVKPVKAPFQPEGGAYGFGHVHDHGQPPDHSHSNVNETSGGSDHRQPPTGHSPGVDT